MSDYDPIEQFMDALATATPSLAEQDIVLDRPARRRATRAEAKKARRYGPLVGSGTVAGVRYEHRVDGTGYPVLLFDGGYEVMGPEFVERVLSRAD